MQTATPDPFATISTGTPPAGTATTVATMMRTGNIPGLSVAVVDRDRLHFAAGYGLADRAGNTGHRRHGLPVVLHDQDRHRDRRAAARRRRPPRPGRIRRRVPQRAPAAGHILGGLSG